MKEAMTTETFDEAYDRGYNDGKAGRHSHLMDLGRPNFEAKQGYGNGFRDGQVDAMKASW